MAVKVEAVIGLEVHVQLLTDSKIFAQSAAVSGRPANTLTDPVTLGLPGSLPVLNKRAVDFAIRLGLATNCKISRDTRFARKHYFYPDLPKGYQISQYEDPICYEGFVEIDLDGQKNKVAIQRIHLEEDAGKSLHLEQDDCSIVDLNRAGFALVEIVTHPVLTSAKQAGEYMRALHQIVEYLEVSDGNLEDGSLRCDANISVREAGTSVLNPKVEVKNLNSFKFVEKAIDYEFSRQTALFLQNKPISQETRLWDEARSVTKLMRSKERAQDYRYFPDPDLPPLRIEQAWVDKIKSSLPEPPWVAKARLKNLYGLTDLQAELLTEERGITQYFDRAVAYHSSPKLIANWICHDLFGKLKKNNLKFSSCAVSPEDLASLVQLIEKQEISGKIAKTVFEEMFASGLSPSSIVEDLSLALVSDSSSIDQAVEEVFQKFQTQVADLREGKEKVLGFLVGQVMKLTKGQADPVRVNEAIQAKLAK